MTSAHGHPGLPPRAADVFRHLEDLRTRTFEGAERWEERVERFRRAAELMDPVVRRVLDEVDRTFLEGTGTVAYRFEPDGAGGWQARWSLSWPEQRELPARRGERIGEVQVVARFFRGFTHPHLGGSAIGHWPMQVRDEADADRQELVVRAIAEAELHERIFEGGWQVVPAFTRGHAARR